jgi:elongation factor G
LQLEKRAHLVLQVSANHFSEISSVSAGNIALLGGLKDTFTGDTLLSSSDRVKVGHLSLGSPIHLPEGPLVWHQRTVTRVLV